MLCLILSVFSCQKSNGEYPFDSLSNGETGAIPAYWIVLPADCSAALYEKAESLALLLSEKVGASVTVKFDYDAVLASNVSELLLGYTSRPLSREYLASLKRDDYLCRSDGKGGAVIGGKTDGATLTAVDRFCEEILPAATAESLMHENAGFFYEGTYPSERTLLNGFDLDCYCLVYPHDADIRIRELTERFRDRIAARSGYVLDVFSDEDIQGEEKQIRLKENTDGGREYLAYIDPTQTGIVISSRGLFGFSAGLLKLESLLFFSAADGVFLCNIESACSVPYERDEYRIGSIQTKQGSLASSPAALTDLLLPVRERLPDGVLFDAMDETSLTRIQDSLHHVEYQGAKTEREELLPAFVKEGAITAIALESAWDGGPIITVYRAGSEAYGFYLVRISGSVSGDGSFDLPQAICNTDLPVVLLLHTELTGGTPYFSKSESHGMRAIYNESYSVAGEAYLFQCYATDGSLEITVKERESGSRYQEITVKQSSVYS